MKFVPTPMSARPSYAEAWQIAKAIRHHAAPDLWERLLGHPPDQWKRIIQRAGLRMVDDPVPKALIDAIELSFRRFENSRNVEVPLGMRMHTVCITNMDGRRSRECSHRRDGRSRRFQTVVGSTSRSSLSKNVLITQQKYACQIRAFSVICLKFKR